MAHLRPPVAHGWPGNVCELENIVEAAAGWALRHASVDKAYVFRGLVHPCAACGHERLLQQSD